MQITSANQNSKKQQAIFRTFFTCQEHSETRGVVTATDFELHSQGLPVGGQGHVGREVTAECPRAPGLLQNRLQGQRILARSSAGLVNVELIRGNLN